MNEINKSTYTTNNQTQQLEYLQKYENVFNLTIRYTTLSEYFSAISQDTNADFPTREPSDGDFFPYDYNANNWWTGYYVCEKKKQTWMNEWMNENNMNEPKNKQT